MLEKKIKILQFFIYFYLLLYSRFHKTVSASLSAIQPEVIELHMEMTQKMKVGYLDEIMGF